MKKFFESLNILSIEELDKIDTYITKRKIEKEDFLIQIGEVSKEIAYIKSGVLRSYFISYKEEEVINCIGFNGDLISAFGSFIQETPSDETIQAIIDTEIEVIQKHNLEQLYETSPNWQKVGRIMTEMLCLFQKERIMSFQKNDATTRYKLLEENNLEYIKHIPLHYIASYLGISMRHLTRIRKSLL